MSNDDDVDVVRCKGCGEEHLVADLIFPEPDPNADTQFGWLVARCPGCGRDLKVGAHQLGSLLS